MMPPQNEPPIYQIPITNQQLEQVNANLVSQLNYLNTINNKLIATNDKLTGIIVILLLPIILSVGFAIIGVILILLFGINIFSWLV